MMEYIAKKTGKKGFFFGVADILIDILKISIKILVTVNLYPPLL